MNPPDQAFTNSVGTIMQTRWLAHALYSSLTDNPGDPQSHTPEKFYLVAQQTVSEASPEATHETLLNNAKRLWKEMDTQTEYEQMGIRFREWLSQQGHTLQDHPRLIHALAVILADVRSAMPDTTARTEAGSHQGTVEHTARQVAKPRTLTPPAPIRDNNQRYVNIKKSPPRFQKHPQRDRQHERTTRLPTGRHLIHTGQTAPHHQGGCLRTAPSCTHIDPPLRHPEMPQPRARYRRSDRTGRIPSPLRPLHSRNATARTPT